MRFTKLDENWYAAWRKGVKVDLEEIGLSEGEQKERWLIRINNEVVDATNTLREAKRLAKQCCLNADY